jgi:uncharacterized protein YndB with AHSA1/START domain
MQKLHCSIVINAPRAMVWETMLGEDTYPVWTKIFNPTSTYEGNWEEGSEIHFIGVNEETGELGGMYSRIKENRNHEYISIEHLGFIAGGVIDTESEAVKKWAPSFENYTFTDVEGGTEVSVDQDIDAEYKEMFEEMWPKALLELKHLCEEG